MPAHMIAGTRDTKAARARRKRARQQGDMATIARVFGVPLSFLTAGRADALDKP